MDKSLRQSTVIALLVAGALFMEQLDGTVIATALPQMAKSFGAEAVDLNIGMSAYLLTVAVFIPASGWVTDRFGARTVFASAIVMFVIPLLLNQSRYAGFAQIYRLIGLLAFFLPVLVLAHWGDGSYLPLQPKTIEHLYQAFGFLTTGSATAVGIRKHWPDVVNTSVTFFIVFLYTKFYDWWWEVMPKSLFFLVLDFALLST